MFFVIILGVWHAIIGSLLFTFNWQSKPEPGNYWLWIDRDIFIALGSLYLVAHVILIIWFVVVPFGYRRRMRTKDKIYHELLYRYNYQHQHSSSTTQSELNDHI